MAKERPNIFQFLNYRSFLREYTDFLRGQKQYTHQSFAKKAGFGSISYLRMVMAGERSLSAEAAKRVAKALGLRDTETKFFLAMIRFNQARTVEDEQESYQDLLKFSRFKEIRKAESQQYKEFSHWYVPAILEALGTDWRFKSLEEQAEDIGIGVQKTKDTLKLLEQLGLIQKTENGWKKLDAYLETPLETESDEIENLYRELADKGRSSLDELPRNVRSHTCLVLPLTEPEYQKLRKKVFEIPAELNLDFPPSKNAENVYQLNLQLFPILPLNRKSKSDQSED